MRRAIRNYAAHHGKPDRYHETVTVAFVALIQQHLNKRADGGGWAGFAESNPELLAPKLLEHFYTRAELNCPLARRVFVLPRAVQANLALRSR
jgi:hypothetical protein